MKRTMILLLCAVVLFTSGCAGWFPKEEDEEPLYSLYFRVNDLTDAASGDALQAEYTTLEGVDEQDAQAMAFALMEKLMEGPRDMTLKTTFPAGTQLLSVTLDRGIAVVDLSAAYGALSGVNLTLADYAIAMTLTQLPEILSTKITVRGQELAYRDKQIFSAHEVLLTPKGDVVATVPVTLYYLNGEGSLSAEERSLELYEGDTQVVAVVRALENAPEDKNWSTAMPEGFRVRTAWLEEEICYVNLSSAQLKNMVRLTGLPNAIQALQRSLCSLESVAEVRFLVDGEFARNYGAVNIEEAYSE